MTSDQHQQRLTFGKRIEELLSFFVAEAAPSKYILQHHSKKRTEIKKFIQRMGHDDRWWHGLTPDVEMTIVWPSPQAAAIIVSLNRSSTRSGYNSSPDLIRAKRCHTSANSKVCPIAVHCTCPTSHHQHSPMCTLDPAISHWYYTEKRNLKELKKCEGDLLSDYCIVQSSTGYHSNLFITACRQLE